MDSFHLQFLHPCHYCTWWPWFQDILLRSWDGIHLYWHRWWRWCKYYSHNHCRHSCLLLYHHFQLQTCRWHLVYYDPWFKQRVYVYWPVRHHHHHPKISALSQMTPLKIANSASMWGHYRSRGLSSLRADFPPYSQIMKIHLRLYLSNTHLLGSRYCLCKNLLHYLILQLLRILIVV